MAFDIRSVGNAFSNIIGGLDSATKAAEVIDYAHHEIHSGSSFVASTGQMVSDTNDRTAIALVTPNTTRWLHMVAIATASEAAWFYIREAPTITNNQGATLAAYNRDRNSTTATTAINTAVNPSAAGNVTYFAEADQADYTENGTLIHQELLASGSRNSTSGGGSRGLAEVILKQNTAYLFYLKSLNANDNYHNIILDWYEHTNLA